MAQTCSVIVSEMKDASARARLGASVQQPFARKLASAPVDNGVAGAAGKVEVTISSREEVEDVIGGPVEFEELAGRVVVVVLNNKESKTMKEWPPMNCLRQL